MLQLNILAQVLTTGGEPIKCANCLRKKQMGMKKATHSGGGGTCKN